MYIAIGGIVLGIVLLYFGAEMLVRGGAKLALRLGITPMIVGLTVVAFGTSSPELVVSFSAGIDGNADIALGNVIGSNICNIALILGVAALIRPLPVEIKLMKSDLAVMIGVSLLVVIMILDGEIGTWDGVILSAGIISYVLFSIYQARKNKIEISPDELDISGSKYDKRPMLHVLFVVAGLVLLIFGANVFVEGAIQIAGFIGVSNAVIGLSVVAFGTSLPELATSMVASIKNEGDLSIGNVIGSNIFNILMILGITALFFPIDSSDVGKIDIGVMLGLTFLIIPLSIQARKLTRWNGAILLAVYFAYVYYLYLQIPS